MRALVGGGLAVLLGLGGCASSPRAADTRPVAECPVCKCNGDLGCLIVRVDATTPRSEYGGKTIYFCGEECKAAFDRAPGKYVK